MAIGIINHIRKMVTLSLIILHCIIRILLICDLTNAYIIIFTNVFDKEMTRTSQLLFAILTITV